MKDIASLKDIICKTVDLKANELNDISQGLWENPELSYNEFKAHQLLTSYLEKQQFEVSRETPLKTSFIARYGKPSGLKVGICCEYDALPGLGHACGHNLIAEAGIGAVLGLKAAMDSDKDIDMQIIVFGTPAEEGGGGKVKMIEAGVFDETDICMMSHPTPYEIAAPNWLARIQLSIIFHGKTSHAAAAPWEGINALDAAIACYNNTSMLRQQIKPSSRMHCIIKDGGKQPNIIPERSEMVYYVRSLTGQEVRELAEKVSNCARGAAAATGCTVEIAETNPFYDTVKTNNILIDLYVQNAKSLGVPFNDDEVAKKLLASTDMGNVSQIKPSIHPCFKITTDGANHTHKFTEAVCLSTNQLPTLNSAKSMAMAAIEVACDPKLMEKIYEDFMKS